MVRVTFSLDEPTVAEIRRTAARLRMAQSHVVREAVADYAARSDRLSERERLRLLGILDRLREAKPSRTAKDVETEIGAVRGARRRGGRRHRSA
jgi:hypothetical protein